MLGGRLRKNEHRDVTKREAQAAADVVDSILPAQEHDFEEAALLREKIRRAAEVARHLTMHDGAPLTVLC